MCVPMCLRLARADILAHFGPADVCAFVTKKPEIKSRWKLLVGAFQKRLGCKKSEQWASARGRIVQHSLSRQTSVLL